MTTDEYLRQMQEATKALATLFEAPESGLVTWHDAVSARMRTISELYYGKEKAEKMAESA